ncbi:hypothetical protein HPB47_020976 [Ixodes persulcatus]|uniref:Uncharacterized protein n=1 Tax=Ixodes persulcatus TaxID=34615 RepID=A0AC60QFX8_IXOPE|nr:hypothetical protein HPB47_020976 [Ixodes persulcatus]
MPLSPSGAHEPTRTHTRPVDVRDALRLVSGKPQQADDSPGQIVTRFCSVETRKKVAEGSILNSPSGARETSKGRWYNRWPEEHPGLKKKMKGQRSAYLFLLTCAALTAVVHADDDGEGPVVHTTTGCVRGFRQLLNGKTVNSFTGIRYGKAPVGALRFREPQPAEPWTGVADATRPAPACTQVNIDPWSIAQVLFANAGSFQKPSADSDEEWEPSSEDSPHFPTGIPVYRTSPMLWV